MSNVFLVGHTGSMNRGCEAILRSTIMLLKSRGIENITVSTADAVFDRKLGVDQICDLKENRNLDEHLFERTMAYIDNKLRGGYYLGEKLRMSPTLKRICADDYVFVIGGDTYCYDEPPVAAYCANEYSKRKNAKTVLWGCTLEEERVNTLMLADLNRYDYIVPRERKTYDFLKRLALRNTQIIQGSDPAFHLQLQPESNESVRLPRAERIIGINVSPIVYKTPIAYRSMAYLIKSCLEISHAAVWLIPHVYSPGRLDLEICKALAQECGSHPFLSVVEEQLNCEQLKYLISQCTAFVGCRTHSTIAAYSSAVPTLAVGYSAKAIGIAEDLLGASDGYAIMTKDIRSETELWSAFEKLLEDRNGISKKLNDLLPSYKQKSIDALIRIFM